LVVLAIGVAGIAAAIILDEVFSSEWSLTIGAPSLLFLSPIGAVWLVVAAISHVVHNRRAG
jgi:hypothetical protein